MSNDEVEQLVDRKFAEWEAAKANRGVWLQTRAALRERVDRQYTHRYSYKVASAIGDVYRGLREMNGVRDFREDDAEKFNSMAAEFLGVMDRYKIAR